MVVIPSDLRKTAFLMNGQDYQSDDWLLKATLILESGDSRSVCPAPSPCRSPYSPMPRLAPWLRLLLRLVAMVPAPAPAAAIAPPNTSPHRAGAVPWAVAPALAVTAGTAFTSGFAITNLYFMTILISMTISAKIINNKFFFFLLLWNGNWVS